MLEGIPTMAVAAIRQEQAGETESVNNFDAVRLIAALLVLCSHQFYLLGKLQPALGGSTLGEMAVMVFFTLSGYLVAQSWYRDPHLMRFLCRRLLRLWPALAAATVVLVLAGAFLTDLPLRDYLGRASWQFVAKNLRLHIVYQLPGVFPRWPAIRAFPRSTVVGGVSRSSSSAISTSPFWV